MAMSYYNKEQGTDKIIDLSFVDITHFSAVMHPMKHETLVKMDVSMAKFVNVNVDSMRFFQTADFTHLHQMNNLIDYIRSVYLKSWQRYEIDDTATRRYSAAHIHDRIFHQVQR